MFNIISSSYKSFHYIELTQYYEIACFETAILPIYKPLGQYTPEIISMQYLNRYVRQHKRARTQFSGRLHYD